MAPDEIPAGAITAALAARAHALSDRPDPVVLSDETLMRQTLEAAAPFIRAGERERLYAELGNECKLSGHMHECAYHEAVALIADEFDPGRLGRWRITGISEGLPDLERAEQESAPL